MQIGTFLLGENDWVPNNARLPVILYRGVENGSCETIAKAFEDRFALNGWSPKWRDTIFDYHHYHSTAHEALGIAAGHATLELGGPGGRQVDVAIGDALLLPVGTGHRCISQSKDFLVVGAYPDGRTGTFAAPRRTRLRDIVSPCSRFPSAIRSMAGRGR